MLAKCGSKKLMQLILENFVIFVISTRFELTSSASNNIFLTPLSNNSHYLTEMTPQVLNMENKLEYNEV